MEASQKVRNFNSYSNQKGSEKKDYDLDLLFYFFLKSYIISSGVTNQVKRLQYTFTHNGKLVECT